MPKTLERDLGLYALITISLGAMLGPGLFVLPGLAAGLAGPAVALAYLLAGVLAVPAALSKAELATAMPGSGGPYLYLDRALGPMMGTISGFGAWLSLIFKAAFALIGLGAYISLLVPAGPGALKLIALGLAVLLVVLNTTGVKETGVIQIVTVVGVLAVLLAFIVRGAGSVDPAAMQPFAPAGASGIFAAAGLVFVSFIGIMKVASIAEEVEDPDRNLPVGIMVSLLVVIVLYPILVSLMVLVVPMDVLATSITPMADAAAHMGGWGAGVLLTGVTVAAVAALVSMANAGLLAASRFPFALSRDDLAPASLSRVSSKFGTPAVSILLSGGLLFLLVAALPVEKLAKLASAFLILIFTFINGAVIVLREGDQEGYEPSFRSPAYPWVQILGIGAGLALLTQMGTLPLLGAIGLVVTGLAWYLAYARPRASSEGAATQALRRAGDRRIAKQTERAVQGDTVYKVLIPLRRSVPEQSEAVLLRIAASLVGPRDGNIEVMWFEEVPDQMALRVARDRITDEELAFEEQTGAIAADLDVPVEAGEVVSHDVDRAVVNHARSGGIDLIVTEWEPPGHVGPLFGRHLEQVVRKAPCDVLLVRDRGFQDVSRILVLLDNGPADPLKIQTANALAKKMGAGILLFSTVPDDATEEQFVALKDHHEDLGELTDVPTESTIIITDERDRTFVKAARDADVILVTATEPHILRRGGIADVPKRIMEEANKTVIAVHAQEPQHRTFVRALVDRYLR